MKVIIVDDEPKAIKLIETYLTHFADFDLMATFRNGLKALTFLNSNAVDVVFLDINMPHLSGLSLSKMISPKTSIIFTTAYAEHAVESYDVNAVDYLLKPISLERFSKAIAKILENRKDFPTQKTIIERKPATIFVKSGYDTHQVRVDEIDYLKKDGNYLYYFVANKKIMARESIKEALAKLPDYFMQIQKSYIVNFSKIDSLNSEFVFIGEDKVPVGSQFRANLLEWFRNTEKIN